MIKVKPSYIMVQVTSENKQTNKPHNYTTYFSIKD